MYGGAKKADNGLRTGAREQRSLRNRKVRRAPGELGCKAIASTLCSEPESIRKAMNQYILLRRVGLVCALFFASHTVHGQDVDWPQFRGPNSNPVGAHTRLAERWSKTENVEWSQEIPGRGWSSPIVTGGRVYVTTVTTERK